MLVNCQKFIINMEKMISQESNLELDQEVYDNVNKIASKFNQLPMLANHQNSATNLSGVEGNIINLSID